MSQRSCRHPCRPLRRAAHLVQPGDLVIVAAYGRMAAEEAAAHPPRVVHVDSANRIVTIASEEQNPTSGGASSDARPTLPKVG